MLIERTQAVDSRLLKRRCVACGYDGALLRNGLAQRCARCGCDLRVRPARSYVEMEGLVDGPVGTRPADPFQEAVLIHRWIAFLFLATFGLLIVIYLANAAFSV